MISPQKYRLLKLSFLILALLPSVALSQDTPQYAVEKIFHIGGPGRWDYATFDPTHHRLYVTRSTHTQAIDVATGKVVADIPGQKRAHGTAIVNSASRGFISDGQDASVLVFDLKTSKVLGKLAAAPDVDGIIYDPGTHRVLAGCGDAQKLIIFSPDIDLDKGKVNSLDLGGSPEFLAADGAGNVFVNLNDKNQIARVDLRTLDVQARWPIGAGERPTGLTIDPRHHFLFIGCRNQKLIVMNSENGRLLADLPIGRGVDACKFDPGTDRAFVSCGDGTLAVISRTANGKFREISVPTKSGARTMAIDPQTHLIYLPTSQFEPAIPASGRPTPKPGTFMIVVVAPKS